MKSSNDSSILMLPFRLLWSLVSFVIGLTGRIIAFFIAVVCLTLGVLLTGTVIGAVVGIPLIIVGLFLLVRSLF